MKAKNGTAIFIAAEALIYIAFLCMDIFGGDTGVSAAIKYSGILLCVLFAVIRAVCLRNMTSSLIAVALIFTAFSDRFLLFGEDYLPGVICFCITQTLYLAVLEKGRPVRNGVLLFFAGVPVTVAAVILLAPAAGDDVVLVGAAAFYAFSFIRNMVLAAGRSLQGERDEIGIRLFTAGLLMFVMCDVNVLLYNLPGYIDIGAQPVLRAVELAGILMWFFYLPSQVMIVLSPKR